MSSSTTRSDLGNSSEGSGGSSSAIALHQEANISEQVDRADGQVDEGECSDSDALLPAPLTADLCNNEGNPSRGRKVKPEIFGEDGEACSPLLIRNPRCPNGQLPTLPNSVSPNVTTDDDSVSSSQSRSKAALAKELEHDVVTTSAIPYGIGTSSHLSISEETQNPRDERSLQRSSLDGFTSSTSERHRSPSPLTIGPMHLQQEPQSSSIIGSAAMNTSTFPNHSPVLPRPVTNVVLSSNHHHQQQQTYARDTVPYDSTASEEAEGFLPTSILNNPPFLHAVDPSVSSSHSNSSSSGLGGIRRFVRSRVGARTRTTAESSGSQLSTQSLGDEDLFALTLNGEDPRLPSEPQRPQQLPAPQPQLPVQLQQSSPQPSQRALWDAARMHSSEQFPPIVWEESSDSDDNNNAQSRRRRRTFSEPSGNRLRGFLFPAPGVRRRAGRQRHSRSVRRHLPRSSSTPSANMLAASPLSTTAAAVLFTSSQASQASIDSFQEYALSPLTRSRQRQQQQQQPSRQLPSTALSSGSNPQTRMSSHSLDDSARAGVGTTLGHRSIVMDGTTDAQSISTIGNSTMARSDPAGGLGESGRQASNQRVGVNPAGAAPAPNLENTAQAGASNEANATDPNREARVRWVRINQRFQLMITFVAICFSLLLFSILISWIVLTSAYVVTFEKECDIPLKFFYWLVTLQLILDIFRNDIMRYVLQWDPAAHPGSAHQFIPARVVAYNIAYLAYALLVLRMGIECVYIEGRQPESSCRVTAPELFQSSVVFVTLTLAAWATIILGYLVPFCFVATLLTLNGYNPSEADDGAVVGTSPIPGGVFPSAYSSNGAPPGTIELLREVDLDECGEQECCICMEDFRTGRHNADDAIVITDCGHILHKNCTSVWLRQARTCPVCRTDIPNAQAERLRAQQVELGQSDANQNANTQQQVEGEIHRPSSPLHQRAPVTPNLPFRPAGRQEVATLIRALRQPRRENRRPRGRRASGSERSNGSLTNRSVGSAGSNPMERSLNERPSNSIEITALNRLVESTSTLNTSEGNRSSSHPTNGDAQYVL